MNYNYHLLFKYIMVGDAGNHRNMQAVEKARF